MSNALSVSPLAPVKPVRPAAAYIGGKRALAKQVIARINAIDHQIYAEPFVGMGGIFFRRASRPKCEIINDYSRDIANFFRVLQHHYAPFIELIAWQLTSREAFDRLRKTDPETLTDMQRAARFLYLQRNAFGGKVAKRSFGVSPGQTAAFDPSRLPAQLAAIRDRLAGVTIEQLGWADFIRRYDRAGALFYLDPPYFGNEGDYGANLFDASQFDEMAEVLGQLKGRFILSINDRPEVRKIFARFDQQPVQCRYTVGGTAKAGQFGELIISN